MLMTKGLINSSICGGWNNKERAAFHVQYGCDVVPNYGTHFTKDSDS